MPDRDKVLTWLEICGKNNDCSGCCPYSENGFGEYGQCRESLMADAYALLKEQDAVVRCRDCKHWRKLLLNHDGCGVCHADNPIRVSNQGWYCADGELKEGVNE